MNPLACLFANLKRGGADDDSSLGENKSSLSGSSDTSKKGKLLVAFFDNMDERKDLLAIIVEYLLDFFGVGGF